MSDIERFADYTRSHIGADGFAGGYRGTSSELLAALRGEGGAVLLNSMRKQPEILARMPIRGLSREVSTHYKWCLYSSRLFSLWLNEYKEPSTTGYARSIHDHRYAFASVVVKGSIRQRKYSVTHEGGLLRQISVDDDWICGPDDSYGLDSEMIHQLVEWSPGTATLVLKGPTQRESSNVFDLDTFTVREMRSMSAMSPLRQKLKELI